ncbi:energy-coupling factor transporter transmembrane protein EcfT [Frigidibacter albus]|uniref:Energy-coupling factor transporter transmembrane protein EcfT n=1 Tax=Frigidibacter albus TaxID=1465486 RepID=A0A6L8VEF6_9RHOB|nr:energy-coupling factor transporter transmembrane component T [Frigidibacter albus]MZQ88728.1 energy-coupling factor transporter transmembrane protein EcfT [Frigidibacter albus]NBE30463.1 energy-coupling factor transporter transmembrane protein EcfT [Frigidibacter albus]GGH50137.1 hypothetical protein GCM10011341_12890 [Frigidibacter albus]
MLGLALPGPSWAHRLPAGAKLAALALVVLALLPVAHPLPLLGAAAVVAALYATLGPRALAAGARMLRPLLWFVGVILLYHLAVGEPRLGTVISLRILVLVGLANLVTLTTPLTEITSVAERLFGPLRHLGVNPRAPALAIALFLRFVPVLQGRAGALAEAWRARSPRRAGPRILVPLMLGTLDDADHVAEALRARGGVAAGANRPEKGTKWNAI